MDRMCGMFTTENNNEMNMPHWKKQKVYSNTLIKFSRWIRCECVTYNFLEVHGVTTALHRLKSSHSCF